MKRHRVSLLVALCCVAFGILGFFVGDAFAISNQTCAAGACSSCPASCLQATCSGNCIMTSSPAKVRNCCVSQSFSSCSVTGCADTYSCGGTGEVSCSCNPPSGTC
jgi:hypothetical protein